MLLDDCYNANPQSVTAALEVLAARTVNAGWRCWATWASWET
ncbi:MAG: hypothetical protein ACLSHO_09185 [Dysosmobacter sp.]